MPNQGVTNSETPEAKVWKKNSVTKEQAEHIEALTRTQADSLKWYEKKEEMLE